MNIAGTIVGCPACLTASPYASSRTSEYQSERPNEDHCKADFDMNAHVKDFDQQVSRPLRYQQFGQVGTHGNQPHYSPCFNQSEWVPCDVHKIYEGGVGEPSDTDETPWNLAWERHPNNVQENQKIQAGPEQDISDGLAFSERFPDRDRAPIGNVSSALLPDQMDDVNGGG